LPKNAKVIIADVRRNLEEEAAGAVVGNRWTDLEILESINEGQDSLVTDIIESAEDYFGSFIDIDFVANQGIYDLPFGFLRHRFLEYTAGGTLRSPMAEGRLKTGDIPLSSSQATLSDATIYSFALYDDQVHIDPIPAGALVDAFRLWFIKKPIDLIYGKATAGGGDTIDLQLTETADGPAAVGIDDVYNRYHLVITAGTGAGQRRRVLDYVASTGQCTMETAWSVPPDTTSIYALETKIPVPFDRMLGLYATIASKDKLGEDSAGYVGRLNALHDKLIDFCEVRVTESRSGAVWDPLDGVGPF
jgi:hypothetical protein